MPNAYLLLQDGLLVEGKAIGREGISGGEICFNTGMTGYQEIYTDPSYFGQILINTATHIGNYGVHALENESHAAMISGLVVDKFSPIHSRINAEESLQSFLERSGVVGISDVDTRKLVRHIRSKGAMNAIIGSDEVAKEELWNKLKELPNMENLELSSKVSTKTTYAVGPEDAKGHVAVLDLGIKKNILRSFIERGIKAKVYPSSTSFEEMEKENPLGYFVSNGPGDPQAMGYAIETTRKMIASGKPSFGICLGHQLFAAAAGVNTYKMHHGHRGINHPVKNIITGKGEITSQNHGFGVVKEEVENHPDLELTHIHLNDGTCAGFRFKDRSAFCVQYHPESSPGPHDSRYLFDEFAETIYSKGS